MHAVLRHLRRAVQPSDAPALTDGQLLDRFIRSRDEDAFAVLVRRHGPMVLGVCRRIAGNVHDADDAFQAAFLVLVRKARAVVPREQVGNYLYGVAYHTALKARAAALRRRGKEKQVTVMPQPETLTKETEPELLARLDAEVQRLPDKLRLPVVLCELEGRSRKEVSAQLGIPEGTLSSRLAQARKRLARRLGGNGPILGATVAVSAALLQTTVEAATLTAAGQATAEVVSANITLLTEGVLKTMFLAKLKLVAGLVLVLGVLGGGLLTGWYGSVSAAEADKSAPVGDQRTATHDLFEGGPKQPAANAPKDAKPAPKPPTDAELIQGTWQVMALSHTGNNIPQTDEAAEQLHKRTFTFTAGRLKTSFGGQATYTLDPESRPKRMTITVANPAASNEHQTKAIYALQGDELILCLAGPGSDEYPAHFAVEKAKPESPLMRYTLKRVEGPAADLLQAADLQVQLDQNQVRLEAVQAQQLQLQSQLKQLAAERAQLEAKREQLEANRARDALKNATKGQSTDKALKTLDEMEKLIQQMKKELQDKEAPK